MDTLDLLEGKFQSNHRFGEFKVYATPVELMSGASYEIPGIPDFTDKTATKQWKGKAKVENHDGATRHIVMTLTQTSKEGEKYIRVKDYLNFDAYYKSDVLPTFKTNGIQVEKSFFAEVEESESGKTYNNHAIMNWKVAKIFATEEEMKAAESAYFAQFSNGETSPAAAGTPAIEIPEGGVWDASTWPAMYDSFVTACSDANSKPEAVRKVLAAKIANDYSVSEKYVSKFITPF